MALRRGVWCSRSPPTDQWPSNALLVPPQAPAAACRLNPTGMGARGEGYVDAEGTHAEPCREAEMCGRHVRACQVTRMRWARPGHRSCRRPNGARKGQPSLGCPAQRPVGGRHDMQRLWRSHARDAVGCAMCSGWAKRWLAWDAALRETSCLPANCCAPMPPMSTAAQLGRKKAGCCCAWRGAPGHWLASKGQCASCLQQGHAPRTALPGRFPCHAIIALRQCSPPGQLPVSLSLARTLHPESQAISEEQKTRAQNAHARPLSSAETFWHFQVLHARTCCWDPPIVTQEPADCTPLGIPLLYTAIPRAADSPHA